MDQYPFLNIGTRNNLKVASIVSNKIRLVERKERKLFMLPLLVVIRFGYEVLQIKHHFRLFRYFCYPLNAHIQLYAFFWSAPNKNRRNLNYERQDEIFTKSLQLSILNYYRYQIPLYTQYKLCSRHIPKRTRQKTLSPRTTIITVKRCKLFVKLPLFYSFLTFSNIWLLF